jgi:GNAT superfamily N-acetyltransferase
MTDQTAVVRPLRPGEGTYVQQVFDGLSPHARFLRFHVPMPRLSARWRAALATVEVGHRYGTLALVDGRAVGFAQWVRDPHRPHRADVSVAVVDGHQRRGVGRLLMADLARHAARHGIEEFSAWVHPENRLVARLLAGLGARPGPGGHEQRLVPVRHFVPGGNDRDEGEGVVVPFPRGVRRPRSAVR